MKNYALLNILLMLIIGPNCYLNAQYRKQREVAVNLDPFTDIGSNAMKSFSGKNIIFQSAAFISTSFLVSSDVDYRVYKYFYDHPEYDKYTTPAVWVGYSLPLVLGGSLYAYGKLYRENEIIAAGVRCASILFSRASVCEFVEGVDRTTES
jgi:hypothetical protein